MRILVAVQYYHPAYSFGGIVVNAVALAEGMRRLGHRVSVVTSSVQDRRSPAPRRSWSETVRGVDVHYMGTALSVRATSFNPAVFRFAFREVPKYDAVHIVGFYDFIGPVVAAAARHHRIPFSVEPSGMLIPIVNGIRVKQAYHRTLGRLELGGARRVVVTSELERRDALACGLRPDSLWLRRNGVDLEEYEVPSTRGKFRRQWGISESIPLILWFGRIGRKKNIEQLLEALSGLKHLPWCLAVVGPIDSDEYMSHLHNRATELELDRRIRWIPPLFHDDKVAAYRDADLFTLVSIHENWGNTVQEAVAGGTPVVVTDTCGVAEYLNGDAGLVVKKSTRDIRDAIERMLVDRPFYEKCCRGLSALANHLSWDEPVQQMVEMFESWKSEKVTARG